MALGQIASAALAMSKSHGYQLETSPRWDNPILQHLKDNTELRATANRRTIELLQERGLIQRGEKRRSNPTVWTFDLEKQVRMNSSSSARCISNGASNPLSSPRYFSVSPP
jgi:hypothetical protein